MPSRLGANLFSVLLGSLLLSLPNAGFCFQTGEILWDPEDFPIEYWVDPEVETQAGPAYGLSILQTCFNQWSEVPSSLFSAEYQGLKEGFVAEDGECHLLWADLGNDLFAPSARAYLHGREGKIQDADIVFNSNFGWSERFLHLVALHEIGHLIGLAHSTSRYAVMYPTSDKTELHFDDIEGITSLYPAPGLCDLKVDRLLYPRYASPQSSGPMALVIEAVGSAANAVVEVTVYVSETPNFGSLYLGKNSVPVEGTGETTVVFPSVGYGAPVGPRYLGLEVDTSHSVFESDETNNLTVFELPIVAYELNGDEDLSGWVDSNDLFNLSLHWWERNTSVFDRYRFDFGSRYFIGATDLLHFLGFWHQVTLPDSGGSLDSTFPIP